jgi:cytochrome oxidase Cu insertion factor (SCO1/SenC/PrrC family)
MTNLQTPSRDRPGTAAALALVAMLAAAPVAAAASSGAEPASGDGSSTIRVGEQAPDFTLKSPDGASYTLSERRGEKNVVLVFFRGTW